MDESHKDIAMSHFQRKLAGAHKGYGIVLLIVFLFSTILIGASLQLVAAPTATAMLGKASQDNAAARQLASSGLLTVRDDILTQLDAGTTVDTTYRYPGASPAVQSVSAYRDPANYAAGSDVVGNYYGTVTYARANTYVIKITATVGGSTVSKSDLFQLSATTPPAPPAPDCTVVESAVAAGNIVSIASADLQAYAQNDCMKDIGSGASTLPAAPTIDSTGALACTTHSGGPAPLVLQMCSGTETANGTYSAIYMASPTSVSGARTITSASSSARTIHIPGAVGASSTFTLTGTGAQTLLFGTSMDLTRVNITTSSGNDIIRVEGTYGQFLASAPSTVTNTINPGDGSNQIYVKALANTNSNSMGSAILQIDASTSTGSNEIYFDSAISNGVNSSTGSANINIYGGSGNDIIGCNQTFASSASACVVTAGGGSGSTGSQTTTIDGKGGNNIISLNGTVTSSGSMPVGIAKIYGGSNTGYNIIYIGACTGTASKLQISPGAAAGSSGKNLIIMGTGNPNGCTFSGQTGSDVFMYKSGTPPAGFGRTLTY